MALAGVGTGVSFWPGDGQVNEPAAETFHVLRWVGKGALFRLLPLGRLLVWRLRNGA